MNTIAGVAARSGGHIVPCLTLIQKARTEDTQVLFFTTSTELDTTIGKQFPWITKRIELTLENVPYKKPWRFPLFGLQCTVSFFKSLYYLARYKPAKLVSTGGYLSLPVCLAAKILRIPIELFELNAVPGKATRVLAPLATTLFTCFEITALTFSKKCTLAPYPLRFNLQDTEPIHKQKACIALQYDNTKKTVLVLGGSQGSTFLNVLLCNTLSAAPEKMFQIIHQTGHGHIQELKKFYKTLNMTAIVFDYQQNLTPYYQAADIIICRSGAGTLFETAFFNKKCITIPLETITNTHQVDNANAIKKQYPDLFTVIRQSELEKDSSLLLTTLLYQ